MATYQDARTMFVHANGLKFAYRLFGAEAGIPLFMHIHFRGTMDHWDPFLINGLAEKRPILLFDNSGVGLSEGEIPPTYAEWAANVAAVARAIGIEKMDALGFSMGGYTVQMLKLNYPELVRRLILAGTGPSNGPGVQRGSPSVLSTITMPTDDEGCLDSIESTFFPPTRSGRAAAQAFFARMLAARPYPARSPFLSHAKAEQQMAAGARFHAADRRHEGSYDRLHEFRGRVLIINGDDDVVIPTENSLALWRGMTGARVELHFFPRAGHGFLDQYAERTVEIVGKFLDESGGEEEGLEEKETP